MRLPAYSHKRARIEIVPMIDTIFFLLVYFMVASLTMTQMSSKKVSLPTSLTADLHPSDKVIITVTKQGQCLIDHKVIQVADITSELKSRLETTPDLTVVINCDKDQPVATFGSVFDLIKQANPHSVMIATTPKDNWTINK